MKAKSFAELYRDAARHDDYHAATVANTFLEELVGGMEKAGISRAELARRLGTSPAYVTKVLRGNANFTLVSLVKLARAVGGELRISIEPPRSQRVKGSSQPAAGGASACATRPTVRGRAVSAAR